MSEMVNTPTPQVGPAANKVQWKPREPLLIVLVVVLTAVLSTGFTYVQSRLAEARAQDRALKDQRLTCLINLAHDHGDWLASANAQCQQKIVVIELVRMRITKPKEWGLEDDKSLRDDEAALREYIKVEQAAESKMGSSLLLACALYGDRVRVSGMRTANTLADTKKKWMQRVGNDPIAFEMRAIMDMDSVSTLNTLEGHVTADLKSIREISSAVSALIAEMAGEMRSDGEK